MPTGIHIAYDIDYSELSLLELFGVRFLYNPAGFTDYGLGTLGEGLPTDTGYIDFGDGGGDGYTITFMNVDAAYLGLDNDAMHPADILKMMFGGQLSTTADNVGTLHITRLDGEEAGGTYADQVASQKAAINMAYMLGGVISALPLPCQEAQTDQVAGFLDYETSWGLFYDADIWMQILSRSEMELQGISPYSSGWASASEQQTNALNLLGLRGWMNVATGGDDAGFFSGNSTSGDSTYAGDGSKYGTYPSTWTEAVREWEADALPANKQYASSFVLEALAYDFIDTIDESMTSIDANEFLHSSELYRSINGDEIYLNDPVIQYSAFNAWSHHVFLAFQPETVQVMCARYHALSESTRGRGMGTPVVCDSYTDVDNTSYPAVAPAGSSWQTASQERVDLTKKIDLACNNISALLSVQEWPQKFINHIQRQKPIPNHLVSAFGYVPDQMYEVDFDTVSTSETEGEESLYDTLSAYAAEEMQYDPDAGWVWTEELLERGSSDPGGVVLSYGSVRGETDYGLDAEDADAAYSEYADAWWDDSDG